MIVSFDLDDTLYVSPNEFKTEKELAFPWNKIYKEMLGQYLDYEVNDHELSEEITLDTIRAEFAETSFAAQFMEQLINDPVELQMAYTMLHECMEG